MNGELLSITPPADGLAFAGGRRCCQCPHNEQSGVPGAPLAVEFGEPRGYLLAGEKRAALCEFLPPRWG